MSSPKSSHSEIAIIGGGLVGLCAALALQSERQSVTVIEATALHQPESDGLNARSIALAYSSVQIFKALDAWSQIKKQTAVIEDIHVSSQGRWGVTRMNARDLNLEAMGYVIENRFLATSLLKQVKACDNINLLTEAEFESIETDSAVRVQYRHQEQDRQLNANLAIIADGANSRARDKLGVTHKTVDYGQSAIITNLAFQKPISTTAFERFTEQGPLAVLPLGGNRYACVWTRHRQETERLMQLDDAEFIKDLQACFGYRMGFIETIGRRFSFELHRTEATELGRQRCLLVGNAANALHPVAGQGFNLALRDIAVLHELLGESNVSDLDETAMSQLLSNYEDNRNREQSRVINLGDGLVSLFSNQLPMLDHLRAGGLAVLDLLPGLKTQVALSGMGMSFDGNAMLRGRL